MQPIDIANTALGRLGQSPIQAFGDNPGTGLITMQNYQNERDSLLRKIPWNFARVWTTLSMLNIVPIGLDIMPNQAAPGSVIFTGAYQLPNDCLRVYRFSPREAHFRIVGRQLYTDAVPALNLGILLGLQPLGSDGPSNQPPMGTASVAQTMGIEYIARIEDTNKYDDMFVECLIWKLTKTLAFGVTGLREVYQLAKGEYIDCLRDAGAVNGMENWPDEFWNTDLTDVRYGYSNVGSFNGGA